MRKSIYATIGVALIFLLVMYFGCEKTAPQFRDMEKSRSLVAESTDIQILLQEAKAELSVADSETLTVLEKRLAAANQDSLRIGLAQELSGRWYALGYPAIAGYYAQELATAANTAEAWSIAGSTYAIALQRSQDERLRSYAAGRAITAYENAISLAPDDLTNQINLALVFTDAPPTDNPMKGIQLLLGLNNSHPDNPAILFHLGRLAIRTGQFDRAIERLEKVLQLDPQRQDAVCLLAEAYQGNGEEAKAATYLEKCKGGNIQ